MSEHVISSAPPPVAVRIASAFHDWLTAEVASSMRNQNAVLDDPLGFQQQLASGMPTQDGKAEGHFDRYKLWTSVFEADPTSEKSLALQIYGAQVGMSGAFRKQCLTFASSEQDYFARRTAPNPLGVNIPAVVANRMRLNEATAIKVSRLVQNSHDTNNYRLETIQWIHDGKPKIGLRKLATLMKLHKLQKAWLELGVDYVIFGAQQSGNELSNVPFMEPLPVTQAEIEYPFRAVSVDEF